MAAGTSEICSAHCDAEEVNKLNARSRNFSNLLSIKLHTSTGERWLEGTVFEPGRPRLTLIDGVDLEAPLEGTLLVVQNEDQPGVIGEVGTILGRHAVNIASFTLGRDERGATGVVNLDAGAADAGLQDAVKEIRKVPAVRDTRVATVS